MPLTGSDDDSLVNQFEQFRMVNRVANEVGVDPKLVHAVIKQESGYNPAAQSPKGAVGLMQLMPGTARDLGVQNPLDPEQNVRGGAQYLKQMLGHYGGDQNLALAAYNAGPGRVDRAGGIPNIPETQNYVKRVGAQAPSADDSELVKQFEAWRQQKDEPQAAKPVPPREKSVGGFAENVLNSGADFVKNLAGAVVHPIDTMTNMSKLLAGEVEHLAPGVVGSLRSLGSSLPREATKTSPSPSDMANAVNAFYKKRYGGTQQIGDTLYNDPVGAAADAAAVLGGASSAAKLGGFTKVGELAQAGASALDPMRALGTVQDIVRPGVEAVSEKLVNSALKVPKALKKRNPGVNIARTVLEEDLPMGQRGIDKADDVISGLNNQVDQKVRNVSGTLVDVNDVVKGLNDVRDNFRNQVNAQPDMAALDTLERNFRTNPDLLRQYGTDVVITPAVPARTIQQLTPAEIQKLMNLPPNQQNAALAQVLAGSPAVTERRLLHIPVEVAQELKKGTYRQLKGKYGIADASRAASIEGEKGLARGLKNEVADIAGPEVNDLNQREGRVIAAQDALQDANYRIQNRSPFGLMDVVAGAATAANPKALPSLLYTLFNHPGPKTLAARTAFKAVNARLPLPPAGLAPALAQGQKATEDVNLRPVTKAEAVRRYQAYLATVGAQGQ